MVKFIKNKSLNKKLRAPRVIKLATDFSGMDASSTAMDRIFNDDPNKFVLMMASDILPEAHKLQAAKPGHQPKHSFNDVSERTNEEEPDSDIYVWTPPCQSFSAAGKGDGVQDPRGKLMAYGVRYVASRRPRCAIMENVKRLMSKRFRPIVKGLTKSLRTLGYNVYWKVLQANDFQVPQKRDRAVMVAIREDSEFRKFKWPDPVPDEFKVTLSDILDRKSTSDLAGRLPPKKKQKEFVKNACKKVYEEGINPINVPVAIDIDCSSKFQTYGVDIARTLTRTRGSQGGPWISSRGRRTTISEMIRIQGFKTSEIPWEKAGITERKCAMMLGNAVPVNLIGHVLANAMWSAGLVSKKVDFPLVKVADAAK